MIFLAAETLFNLFKLMEISDIILEGKFTTVERERILQRPLLL